MNKRDAVSPVGKHSFVLVPIAIGILFLFDQAKRKHTALKNYLKPKITLTLPDKTHP